MLRLSAVTARLFRLLVERPGRYTLSEVKQDLGGVSKTAILASLAELEDNGLIIISTEEKT